MKKLIYVIGVSVMIAPCVVAMESQENASVYAKTLTVTHVIPQHVSLGVFLPSHNALCLPCTKRSSYEDGPSVALIDVNSWRGKFLKTPSFHKQCPGYLMRIGNSRTGFLDHCSHEDDTFFTSSTTAYDNDKRMLFLGKNDHSCATLVAYALGGSTPENATVERSTVFQDGEGHIEDISLMPGNRLAGIHHAVKIWDVETAVQTHSIKPEHTRYVEKMIMLTPHTLLIAGNTGLIASNKSILHVWDLRASQSVQHFDSEGVFTETLKPFTSEDTFLISNERHKENTLQQWDIKMGKPQRQFKGGFYDVALHNDHLISASRKKVYVWDIDDASEHPKQTISITKNDRYRGPALVVGSDNKIYVVGKQDITTLELSSLDVD